MLTLLRRRRSDEEELATSKRNAADEDATAPDIELAPSARSLRWLRERGGANRTR